MYPRQIKPNEIEESMVGFVALQLALETLENPNFEGNQKANRKNLEAALRELEPVLNRVFNATLNPTATGLSTVSQSFTFVAGTTYWMGWNCNVLQGTQTTTACNVTNMAPLMLQFPITTPQYHIGYSTQIFTTGAPPATINLTTFTKTNAGCVQIYMSL